MDPLRVAIATAPLAGYFLLLGLLNLRRHPFMTTGACDLAALGVAITGLVFIGPLELFRPEAATSELHNYIWVFLLAFYWLWVALVALVMRPRLVVYNISAEELRPALAEAARQVDSEARWAGDNLLLPRLGVQLHLESFGLMRHVSLVSSGPEQSLDGWRRLRRAMSRTLGQLRVQPNPRAVSFFIAATAVFAFAMFRLVSDPLSVAKAASEIFSF